MRDEPDGGVMVCTRVSEPRSRGDLTFEWVGGNIARLYRDILASGVDPHGVLSNRNPNVGDTLFYGDFPVRCIASNEHYIDLERI